VDSDVGMADEEESPKEMPECKAAEENAEDEVGDELVVRTRKF